MLSIENILVCVAEKISMDNKNMNESDFSFSNTQRYVR